jgi:hypothetical protein
MAKFIAIFNDTISDIEVNGFNVMTDKEVDEYEELAYSITWPFSYNIGEYEIEFSNGDELLTKIEFKEITFEESKTLKKVFNNKFGVFIGLDFLVSIVGEEDDLNSEDEFSDDDYDGYGTNLYDEDEYDENY